MSQPENPIPAARPTKAAAAQAPFEPAASPVQQSSTPQEPLPADDVYQVQSGDNYWTISRQFYGSARFFSALAAYNQQRIPDPSKMKPGMYVLVPHIEVLHQQYPQLTGGGPRDPGENQPPGFFVDDAGHPAYRVGKGDTLTEIAQKHLGRASRWVQIYGMNKDRIPDGKTLKIGSVLQLPADASQIQLAPANADIR
jgi:nucleoid-associated protein YgaU